MVAASKQMNMAYEPPCNYCDTGSVGEASGEGGASGGIVLRGSKLAGERKNRLGCDCGVWGLSP